MNVFRSCTDISDIVPLCPSQNLFLKPIARLNVSVQLPQLKAPDKSISSWEVMERLRKMIKPDKFSVLRVTKSTLEFIRFEGEVETRGKLVGLVLKLDGKTIKLSGFSDPLKVRAAEAKIPFPTRHVWDSFFREAKNMNEMKPGERPDTMHITNLPCKWFTLPEYQDKDTKPSEYIFRKVFESFGEVRYVDLPCTDPYRGRMKNKESAAGLKTFSFDEGHSFEGYVQYKEYMSFLRAMTALKGMQLLYKDRTDNAWTATVKVDFDRTKHMTDHAIRRRHVERERLVQQDATLLDKERKAKEVALEKKNEDLKKEEEEMLRQTEQEEKKKNRKRKSTLVKVGDAEKERRRVKKRLAKEERKLQEAQKKLTNIHLLDLLLEKAKVKRLKQALLKKKVKKGKKIKMKVKTEVLTPKPIEEEKDKDLLQNQESQLRQQLLVKYKEALDVQLADGDTEEPATNGPSSQEKPQKRNKSVPSVSSNKNETQVKQNVVEAESVLKTKAGEVKETKDKNSKAESVTIDLSNNVDGLCSESKVDLENKNNMDPETEAGEIVDSEPGSPINEDNGMKEDCSTSKTEPVPETGAAISPKVKDEEVDAEPDASSLAESKVDGRVKEQVVVVISDTESSVGIQISASEAELDSSVSSQAEVSESSLDSEFSTSDSEEELLKKMELFSRKEKEKKKKHKSKKSKKKKDKDKKSKKKEKKKVKDEKSKEDSDEEDTSPSHKLASQVVYVGRGGRGGGGPWRGRYPRPHRGMRGGRGRGWFDGGPPEFYDHGYFPPPWHYTQEPDMQFYHSRGYRQTNMRRPYYRHPGPPPPPTYYRDLDHAYEKYFMKFARRGDGDRSVSRDRRRSRSSSRDSRGRGRRRSHSRRRSYSRSRSRSRSRRSSRSRSSSRRRDRRSRSWSKRRSYTRSRSRSRTRSSTRSRSRSKSKARSRSRSKSRTRSRSRSKSRTRSRWSSRSRSKSKERSRSRSTSKARPRSTSKAISISKNTSRSNEVKEEINSE